MLKRHLEQASENPDRFDQASFSEIMREVFQRGLVQSELPVWKAYRKQRGMTSHTYDGEKARVVFERVPDFLREARYLRDQLRQRNETLDAD